MQEKNYSQQLTKKDKQKKRLETNKRGGDTRMSWKMSIKSDSGKDQ